MMTLLKKLEKIRQWYLLQVAAALALASLSGACAQPAIGGGGFAMAVCGNKVCEAGEVTSCPADCAQGCQSACSAAVCTAAGEIQDCVTAQTGCKLLASAKACPSGQKCSAGQCTGGGTGSVGCGDGVCSTGEKATCPLDCPGGCGSPCAASVCGPGGGVRECTAGPDGCSVLGAEKACPAGSQCTGDACVSLSKDHAKIESVKFFGEKTGFPTYLAPMFGKTIEGSKFSVVHDLVLTNPTEEERSVTVKAWLLGFSEEGGTPEPIKLGPGETKTISYLDIPFTCGKVDPVVTETQATYKLAIYENGVEVDARKASVTMLPRGTVLWMPPGLEPKTAEESKGGFATMSGLMASLYTTKNDSWGEVDKLVAEANKLAKMGLTGFPMTNKPDQELEAYAREALVAIFKALKARGVAYSSVGTDYFTNGQNVRYPAESLVVGSQNCIDGALVFASALERMDYHPVIVLIAGHAFVGARAAKGGPLVFIETTMVGSASAEKAVDYASDEVAENFDESSPYQYLGKPAKIWSLMVDVRALHEEAKLPSSFFPCGAKPAPAPDPCGTNPQCKCQKSLDCKRNGKCTVVSTGSGCGVVTSADCAKSTDCTDWGMCTAMMQNGEMVCGKAGTGPVCGNTQCEPGETAVNCPKDCQATGPVCGNAKCEMGENSSNCKVDCPVAGPVCGNGKCESGETSSNCKVDCPPAGPVCGDGKCESGENSSNCKADCPANVPKCGDLICASGESSSCPADCMTKFTNVYKCLSATCGGWYDCVDDEFCAAIVNCIAYCNCDTACAEGCFADYTKNDPAVKFFGCAAKETVCGEACPAAVPVCGDGLCQGSESCQSCAKDCGGCAAKCGNGLREAEETKASCAADCAPAGSCANNCGKQVGSCFCDAACVQNGDCCPDYAVLCAASHPCDAACGGKAPTGCYCDAGCKQSGDCCSATGQANQYSCAGSTCGVCK